MNPVELLITDGWKIANLDYAKKENYNVNTAYFLEKDEKKLRVIDLLLAPTQSLT